MRMPHAIRCMLAVAAAISAQAVFAAGARAEPEPEKVLHGRALQRESKREISAVVLPQLFHRDERRERRYKDSTILQLDAKLGEKSDLVVRIQAKQRKFFVIEIRF